MSRQPVEQAVALLRNQGVVPDAPGRGLIVTTLHPGRVRQMNDIRVVIEGLACRRAAETGAALAALAAMQGPALHEGCRKAVASDSIEKMLKGDMRLRAFIHALSGNALIAASLAVHLTCTQRVMGEALVRDENPRDIWDQYARVLGAITDGNGERAEALVRWHITQASSCMAEKLRTALG